MCLIINHKLDFAHQDLKGLLLDVYWLMIN
jgi:hypothetical protein